MGTTFLIILLITNICLFLIYCYLQAKLRAFKNILFGELIAYCSNEPSVYEGYREILKTPYILSYRTYKRFSSTIKDMTETCAIKEVVEYIYEYEPNRLDNIIDWCVVMGQFGSAIWVASYMQLKEHRVCQSAVYACDKFVAQNNILNYGKYPEYMSASIYNTFVSVYNMAHSHINDEMKERYLSYIKDAVDTGILGITEEETKHNPSEFGLDKHHPVYDIHYEGVGAEYAKTLIGSLPVYKVLDKLCDAGYFAAAEMYCCQLYDTDFKQENEKCGYEESLLDNFDFVEAFARVLCQQYCEDDITIGHSKFYPELCDLAFDNLPDEEYDRTLKIVDLKAKYVLSKKKEENER